MGAQRSGRETALVRMRDAVETLSLPGEDALDSLPVGAHRADRLALLFDEEYTAYVASLSSLPSESQLGALQALDAEFSAMSDPSNRDLWTEVAVREHPQWEQVRLLARKAMREFGW